MGNAKIREAMNLMFNHFTKWEEAQWILQAFYYYASLCNAGMSTF
jgi:hypothetical protein